MGEEVKIKWVDTPASSNVYRIGYNEETMQFYVEFLTGKMYVYDNVPKEKWVEALSAPSIGKFLNSDIKGKFESEIV
jgi:hypothetical protein